MIKYIKYLLVFLLATGFVACSEDEGAQILGGLYEKVDITPEPGMNLVGRVTDGTGPIEGVVVSCLLYTSPWGSSDGVSMKPL